MILHGDCLDEMRKMADNSISGIVCDPPYFLTNKCGSGFMGKSWDSTHDLEKYVWENKTFVNFAINFFKLLRLDRDMEEVNIAQENANTLPTPPEKKATEIVLHVKSPLLSPNARKSDSAHLLVTTRAEVLGLLKELSPRHTKLIEAFENGEKENALFVLPISLLRKEINHIAQGIVLKEPIAKETGEKEIQLTLMDQAKIESAIEATIGMKLENSFTGEITGNVSFASLNARGNRFNAITLSHIERVELMTWLTSLLCAINAIRESKTIQNYLIDNFFRVIFTEALRICKPGSYVLAFSGTRTHHKLTSAVESVGWEIRDTIYWNYGSGFPKSHNNFGIEGFGTALKPAVEPCLMAMKPCDGTFKQNAEKWGQAGINIDACRIAGESWGSRPAIKLTSKGKVGGGFGQTQWESKPGVNEDKGKGRWPANVIFDEEAAKMLDEQSGVSKSPSGIVKGAGRSGGIMGKTTEHHFQQGHGDSGGASRFFYCAKTSSRERNEGLEELPTRQTVGGGGLNNTEDDVCGKYGSIKAPAKNNHPTVKPLKLMRYLITLIMPPKDGILLDPFAGSGSTIIAAHQLGVKAIGIEKQAEYVEIANKRLEYYKSFKDEKEPDLFDRAINQ